jgi:hypothetical protein
MRRRALAAITLASVMALAWPGLAPGPARSAEEYALETSATYEVRPDDRRIEVSVEATFTNTTPDPEGQFSVFEEVKLAVHDQATEATASDEEGELAVEVATEEDANGSPVNVATIALRDDVRFEETATFTFSYALPDGDDPGLRVRPSAVVFPAWGFGTSSEVSVTLPQAYEARVDGDPLTLEGEALVSGEIADPAQWLALVTAVRPASFVTLNAAVPLAGGTADLEVRAFEDDPAWGERTLALIEEALPLIEEELGLPYPRLGRLILTETVVADASGFGENEAGGTEILVAFDQPPFTAVHQVSHVWLSPTFVESRWLREGLTSHFSAAVAGRMELALPYDPVVTAEERAAAAFPLDSWSANAGPDGEAFGYAASWAFVNDLADRVGPEAIRQVLARVAAGVGPYRASTVESEPEADGVAAPPAPLTTRSFLDHLEAVSGADLTEPFSARVLTEADIALLPARAEARVAFVSLVERAGSWGAPDPTRGAMTAWSFDDAREQIQEATAWLEERDALLADIERAGLSAPERLQQAYRSFGGGSEAQAELEAERAVVDAYADTLAEVNAERSVLERIGLIGGADPERELGLANGRFAEGDLRGSVDAISEAQRILDAAETGGIVRLASALLVVAILVALAVLLYRRRASYTSAP